MQIFRHTTAIALLIFTPGCMQDSTDASFERMQVANRDKLQELATSACECELAKTRGKDRGCWAKYEKAALPFRADDNANGVATACDPVSTQFDELSDGKGNFSIVTGYHVNGVELDDPRLCRVDEARVVEQAFSDAFERAGNGPIDQDAVDQQARAALAAVRAGNSVAPIPSQGGCV